MPAPRPGRNIPGGIQTDTRGRERQQQRMGQQQHETAGTQPVMGLPQPGQPAEPSVEARYARAQSGGEHQPRQSTDCGDTSQYIENCGKIFRLFQSRGRHGSDTDQQHDDPDQKIARGWPVSLTPKLLIQSG